MSCCFAFDFGKCSFKLSKGSSSHKLGAPTSPSVGKRGAEEKSPPVVCFREKLIEFVPTAEALGFEKTPATVSDAMARLEHYSDFIDKVGEDELRRMLIDFRRKSSNVSYSVRFNHHAETALAFATLREDGEHEFMLFRTSIADRLITKAEVDKNMTEASVFYYGSFSLIEESPWSTHLAAMDIANKSGCILSFTPTLLLPGWLSKSATSTPKANNTVWDQADVVTMCWSEFTWLVAPDVPGDDPPDDPPDDNQVLDKLGLPNVKLLILTEGPGVCRYYTKEFHGSVHGGNVLAQYYSAKNAFVCSLLKSLASDPNLYKDEEKLMEALILANSCEPFPMPEVIRPLFHGTSTSGRVPRSR
ncbi:unnamed protein product [Ilex paraguariensis]|uniref:Carbohydrate kinase PfkB domain-containing protein n=1 Tax=Ilex paraguariensis TaxID=185542 RepID=A0ABC8QSI0_9AQUA